MGFTGETGFRDLFKTCLHFDEMLSRQNWGKFKEFPRTWPMIFNNIFSLLPPSPTLCRSQMLRGWQGETRLASSWQGMRTTLSQGVKEVSPPAPPVGTGEGKDPLSTPASHPLRWGLRLPQPSLRTQLLLQRLFVLWVNKIWKGSETTSPKNKRTEVKEKPQESFPNVFLPQAI